MDDAVPLPTKDDYDRIRSQLLADPTSKFGSRATVVGERSDVNDNLRLVDEWRLAHGQVPLSVLVQTRRGEHRAVCSVFWETVERHNLRKDGETDDELVKRYRDRAAQEEGRENTKLP